MKPTDSSSEKENSTPSPTSWKRGSKVTNATGFGQEPTAPVRDEKTDELTALELLKQKKKKRLQEDAETITPKPSHHSSEKKSKEVEEKVVESSDDDDDADENDDLIEDSEETETPHKEKKSSNAGFISIIVILLVLLIGAGAIVWKQKEEMKDKLPEVDPYMLSEQRYNNSIRELTKTKLIYLQAEQDLLNLKHLNEEKSHLDTVKRSVTDIAPQKQELKQQIEAVKAEMLAYYDRYKANTQKQAKGLALDQLITRSGKQYLDVSVNRCTDSQISITHASGATRLPISDLPDALLDRLAYTNPFDDIVLEKETLEVEVPTTATPGRTTAKAVAPQKKNVRSLSAKNYEPPVGKPAVKAPTQFDQPAGKIPHNMDDEGVIPMDDDLPEDLGLLPEL